MYTAGRRERVKPTVSAPLGHLIRGEGAPVLLLHGLGGDSEQAADLVPADWPGMRIIPQMPGHGTTLLRRSETAGFDAFAALAARLLDALHAEARIPPGPLPVLGVSMGAGIAVTLAYSRRDLVSKLVLVRPSWLDAGLPVHLAPFPVIAGLLQHHGPAEGARLFQAGEIYQSLAREAPAMAASLLKQFARPMARRHARVLVDMPASCPLPSRDCYVSIDVDTLVVASGDPVHPASVATALHEWIPSSRLVEIPSKSVAAVLHRRALHDAVVGELAGVH